MFPGRRFATPYFIEFGRDGSGQANVATTCTRYPTTVFGIAVTTWWWAVWRDPKSVFLNGSDWEFFTGGNGDLASSWTKNMNDAEPALKKAGRFGMQCRLPAFLPKVFHDRVVLSCGGGKDERRRDAYDVGLL